MDIAPVIPGNLRCQVKDEAWKHQISQFFMFKIRDLKITLGRGPITWIFNFAVHKSGLLKPLINRKPAWVDGRSRLFYQAGSCIARTIACLKFVHCSAISAKSRFTKRFCLFSTVFVDNFVENDVTTFIWHGNNVYFLQSTDPPATQIL